MSGFWPRAPGRFALLLALIASLSLGAAACEDDGEQLKIGYLADFSGPLAEYGADIETGVQLAIKHINEADGVNGQDVVYVTGDTRVDPTQSVEEARRLVDVEGVHAIVGPLSSTATLAVADSVTGPGGIPHISPSATSPALTDADDDGYLFRTTGSDAIQGVVLAQLVESEGHTNVGVIFRDDAWGQGLSEVFNANYRGTATLASYAADGQPSYLAELQQAASGGAEVLVAMGFVETEVFLRESIENGIFTRFIFTDGNKSEDLIELLGAEALEGIVGTAPSSNPDNASTKAWAAAYMAEYGRLPSLPFVREAYDAVIAIALAAEAAGSTDGEAIRDELARIAGPPGDTYVAGAAGVKGRARSRTGRRRHQLRGRGDPDRLERGRRRDLRLHGDLRLPRRRTHHDRDQALQPRVGKASGSSSKRAARWPPAPCPGRPMPAAREGATRRRRAARGSASAARRATSRRYLHRLRRRPRLAARSG